jgi:hypothetical protein
MKDLMEASDGKYIEAYFNIPNKKKFQYFEKKEEKPELNENEIQLNLLNTEKIK